MSGFDPDIVFAWLDAHCQQTERGRYTTIRGRVLEDTHRDTFDRWRQFRLRPGWLVPLGRWDEILCYYGLMLWEFEAWAEDTHGWNAYLPIEEAA